MDFEILTPNGGEGGGGPTGVLALYFHWNVCAYHVLVAMSSTLETYITEA